MNRSVLFVDDEPEILNSLKRQFRKSGITLLTATSGEEGLKIMTEKEIPLVISDARMPGMGGIDFLQKVKESYPDTIRIILSGYADSSAIIDAINKGEVFRFLAKPWQTEELLEAIDQSLKIFEIRWENKLYMDRIIEENRRLKKGNLSRNTILELTSEILEDLPVPVLVLNRENQVVLYNSKMKALGNRISEGEVEQILTDKFLDQILQGFDSEGGQGCFNFQVDEIYMKVLCRSLRNHDQYKGLVIIEYE
jgi:response regulator RpfG family c-di-GMP phosphodiesterase